MTRTQQYAAVAHGSTSRTLGSRRRFLTFLGPAILVSVGYMDPGNWATDLEGGARFGYDLIWVLVVSNAMALLLQTLCARLGIVSGLDLASACREHYSKPLGLSLWVLAELAIIACDLAEVLGSAVALNLLFGVPLLAGALLTCLDVLLLLAFQRVGMRRLEAFVLVLLLTIAGCMVVELWLARPSMRSIAGGLQPKLTGDSLYVAIGILGATVMPHNLYLHSALVPRVAPEARPAALRSSMWSTALALNVALLVNAAILIVAAATFSSRGMVVTDLREAHQMLAPLLGTSVASLLFAVGLLCSGQSATLSGTLAGQIVMEGFLKLRLPAVLRRALTRCIAIVPALGVLAWAGDEGLMPLLVASQVVLSIQLPFAVVPLIKLTSCGTIMGRDRISRPIKLLASACALLVVGANAALVIRTVEQLHHDAPLAAIAVGLAGAAALGLLCIIGSMPLRARAEAEPRHPVDMPRLSRVRERADPA
jgi:manganese transport protein